MGKTIIAAANLLAAAKTDAERENAYHIFNGLGISKNNADSFADMFTRFDSKSKGEKQND